MLIALGCRPGEVAWCWLSKCPTVKVFDLVMFEAQGAEVVFAGHTAFRIGCGVIELAFVGWCIAAGESAGFVPDPNVIGQAGGGENHSG